MPDPPRDQRQMEPQPALPVAAVRDPFAELKQMDVDEKAAQARVNEVVPIDMVAEVDQCRLCAPENVHESDYPDQPDMGTPPESDVPEINAPDIEGIGQELENDMMDL